MSIETGSVVRVLCSRCRKKLGDLHGAPGWSSRQWAAKDAEIRADGGKRYRCGRCGADYPARLDKLRAAYERAAARTSTRERVIMLPTDL